MTLELIGRSSSHFTRVTRMFAHELSVALTFRPVFDMSVLSPDDYGGHPALKLPTLRRGDELVLGAENICRALAETSDTSLRIVWPEHVRDTVARNAQELIWHGMAAQVQLIVGTRLAKLPADNLYFVKCREGFVGALSFLDARLDDVLRALPAERDLSLLEVTLYCLVEHLRFRTMVPIEHHHALLRFAEQYGERPSAQHTAYRVDEKPA